MKYIFSAIFITFTASSNLSSQVFPLTDSFPVRVTYFSAVQINNKTRLDWRVACYVNYANFEIQRSKDGSNYATINTFTADRLRCLSPFVFDDIISFNRIYYRLKVGDRDGNISTSKVLVTSGKEKSFEIISISPNLVTNSTLMNISSGEKGKADISLINYQGFVAKRFITNLNKGANDVKMNLGDLPKGLYIIKIANAQSDIRLFKIVKL